VAHGIRLLIGIVLVVPVLAGCNRPVHDRENASREDSTRMSSINDVLEAHTPELMKIPGVVGTGIGEEKGVPCILVFVRRKDDRLRRQVPAEIDGYRIRIDEVGEVRPVE
jgi:hypothetical protein